MIERGPEDPKGLIAEAYRMEGLGRAECRSIFLDWALGVTEPAAALPVLVARHGARDHPMTDVLLEGLDPAPEPTRRGGARGRRC
jgi:hypothetical protein